MNVTTSPILMPMMPMPITTRLTLRQQMHWAVSTKWRDEGALPLPRPTTQLDEPYATRLQTASMTQVGYQ